MGFTTGFWASTGWSFYGGARHRESCKEYNERQRIIWDWAPWNTDLDTWTCAVSGL
jgi:hypothetical protein